MKSIKFKIYITLLLPFILCGIGLFSVIHFFTDPDIPMEKYFYGWGYINWTINLAS